MPQILLDAFPAIGLDAYKRFRKGQEPTAKISGAKTSTPRLLLDKVAAEQEIDPLIPESWYLLNFEKHIRDSKVNSETELVTLNSETGHWRHTSKA